MGTVCNSPSSCFVASFNGRLSVYQALVDGRGLLSQLHSLQKNVKSKYFVFIYLKVIFFLILSETKEQKKKIPDRGLSEIFNIVSTQSTAKPGCVLYISDIIDSDHVFFN